MNIIKVIKEKKAFLLLSNLMLASFQKRIADKLDIRPGQEMLQAVASAAPTLMRDVRVFDIYQGPGIEAGRKSVAIGLILQETSRTLTDDDADSAMAAAIAELKKKFAAYLRD